MTEPEFATWLSPPDALASLESSWSAETKKNWILKRLATGEVKAATAKGLIHPPMWKPRWHWFGSDFWQTGDLTFFDGPEDRFGGPVPGVQCTKIEMHGVRFDPAGFPSPPGAKRQGCTPTPAEFEHWVKPGEALERFHPAGDVAERKRAIIRRLATGRLLAGGYGDTKLVVILAARWRDWHVSDASLWTIGDVTFSRGGRPLGGPVLFVDGAEYNPPEPEESVTFTEVRFDPDTLGHEFSSAAAAAAAASPEPEEHGGSGKIASAEVERFVTLYLEIWGTAATEMKALAAIRACYPDASIGRDSFLAKFRELRGPGKVGKPPKNNR